jgi:cytochrome P450
MDPLSPPPPAAPFFDRARDAWVLSRYADVLAAFREPRLWPVGAKPRERSQIGDEATSARLRVALQTALAPSQLAAWEARFIAMARETAERLPAAKPVDLVAEFAMPWSLRVAMLVTEADPARGDELAELARTVSAASAEPYDEALRSAKAAAHPQLERHFENARMPMAAAAFVGLSYTLPSLLASMWVALLRHPAETEKLRADRGLMPRALEELLRYAGLPRVLHRQALAEVIVGSIAIAEGGRATLQVASANRDAEQFPDPGRLDLSRRHAGQLSLGAGGHSCGGAVLIRMAAAVGVRVFVDRFAGATVREPVEWQGGSGFLAPKELWAEPVLSTA